MLILFWLTSKLFIKPFNILEGYITESGLYCLLFYNQVQETQVEPTCSLKKNKNPNQKPLYCRACFLYFSHIL